ncbi:type I phosphomannose isomerase catalytic subunit [Aquimarina sp. 2201CG14-23]|uniref:type I phosphomannose isomerase catalytic subunit n=1 Tax=Aquimarina mycalae TaxID=3040073 RepID=UPI0024781975|nr:type I phosphomannose isomerase catalytic subunit [Aquimarina sp. 2201CG14-23]MDH7446870.1 mannose-6-phosphate isomerase [Aquimarina sp. 2201CG14-23]
MNKGALYILKFKPILKEKIWGGDKLKDVFGKESSGPATGESWEISDVEEDQSVIQNGRFSGKTLKALLIDYKEKLVGEKNFKRFGTKFPLLIKFIDAKEDLSVQLHPGDEIAKQKHNSLGKTEMWYVVQSDNDANIIVGFNQEVTPELYQKHVAEKSIKDILHYEPVDAGDTFFIYSGLIHAIGKGVLLAEIQQTSDITYRVYDWDRTDANGNHRELHQQDALEAIDFKSNSDYKITYNLKKNQITDLVSCPHFITNIIEADHEMVLSHVGLDSFVVYMCVEGQAMIESEENTMDIALGETILVPASIKQIKVISKGVKLLQTYI